MGKRRGDDVLVASVPAVVTETSYTTNTTSTSTSTSHHRAPPAWMDSASFDHKLWVVRESLKLDSTCDDDTDDFLFEVEQCHAKFHDIQRKEQTMTTKAQHIQQALMEKIKQEEAKCQMESANVQAMEKTFQETVQERDSLTNDIADLNRMRDDLEQKIALALEEANQEVESIDMVEEARKNQVPRLKHQISLYANTTGIKWDFENDKLLEGHVSIPSKEVVRSFSIDPQEYTNYEIANQLWGVMGASRAD